MSNWSQQICKDCWYDENPDQTPVAVKNPEMGVCCFCGKMTKEGIYIRINPNEVPYPTYEDSFMEV